MVSASEAEALIILQRMDARLDQMLDKFDELDGLFTKIERHMADIRVSLAWYRNELPRPCG